MAIQTRGQITLLSKPDVTISMTPELITIPVNSNGELIDSLSFTETIAIQAKDSKGKTLYFESINIDETGKSKDWLSQEDLVKEGLLEIIQEVPGDETSPIIGYRYFFKRTKEQVKEELNSTGFINFGFVMENKFDIADDDFSDYRTISYIKAKSGQDGTPAYSVDIAGEQQVFVRTINPDGTYSYEPETITLTAVPINFEGSSFEPYYKWFKYGTEENYLQQGQGEGANKLEIFPDRDGYGVGVYVCEIYRSISGEIEDSPVARDYASIGMATNGIDNYTVSLTNDNAVVTVDNLQHALEDGTVSTGIIVYKGANKINPNDYFIEIENEKDGEVKFSAILNTEDPDNSFWEIQASYTKGEYVGAIGEFIIKVGGMDFKKRFQVSPSLMGGTSRLIKISGQQYFRINQDGSSYTPNDITLTAHLSNVEFLRWEYQDPQDKEKWITISDASLSLDVNFDGVYWQEDNLAKFRAVATAENIEYYDEYTVYKFKEGQNSINVIASNESINIITDVFGKIDPSIDNTIETIYFTVFDGADASTDIKIPEDKIEITPDVSSMISVSSQSNALKIGITRDNNKVFTPATIKVELSNGATKTISLKPLQQGLSARTLTIYGNQVFKYSNSTTGEIKYNPSQITIHTQYQNIESYSWYYRIGDGPNQDLTVNGDSYSFTPSNFSGWLADQILTIGVKEKNPPADSTAITDEITIHQVYDGSNGKDSSLVFLNNPSITITEDSEGKLVGETFECEVLGITGNENVIPTGISWDNKPNWMSITLNETKLQLEVSDDVPTSDIQDRQGFITIYTTSPINVSMQLHWTIVKNGKDGQNGIDYALTPSQAVLRKDANSGISPSELTFSATIKEGLELAKPLIGYIECYSSTDGENFGSNPIKANTNSSLTITADAGWAAIKGKLYEDSSKKVLLDEQTVIVIESSSASFVASLDNEYIPIVCDADGNILSSDGNLGTCKITAYLNGIEITDYSTNLSIEIEEGAISYVGPDNNGQITILSLTSDKAKIKFTVTQTINNTSTEIEKYLRVEKIKQGKDGQDGQPGPQGPTGPTGPQGPQGPQGDPGQDAKEIDRIIKYYVKYNDSASAPPANGAFYSNNSWTVYGYADGVYTYWQTTIPDLDTTNKYIWSLDLITYKNNTNDYLITNIKRDYGAEGLLIAQDFDISGLENYFTRTDGLIQFAQGSDGISLTGNNSIFKVTSNAMGFFGGTGSDATPLCYYENGNMVLRGTVYANEGVIGGVGKDLNNAWRIQGYNSTTSTPAAIFSGSRDSLGSIDDLGNQGIYLGTNGISLYSNTSEDEENYLIYNLNKGILEISGNIIADSLIVKEKIEIGNISGLGKPFIRKTAGIYSGTSNSGPSEAEDGDIYIKYTSSTLSNSGNTSAITVSGSSTDFNPDARQYAKGSNLHGQYAYWNFWSDTSGQTQPGNSYVKVGRASSDYKNGSCRMIITPTVSGANSVSSFTLNITGHSGLTGNDSHYESDRYEGNGTATVKIYNSSDSTTPIAESSFSLGEKTYSDKTYSVNLLGQITSGSTYYVTITASKGSLLYVKNIYFSGSTSAVSSFSPAIKLKSSGQWYTLGAEGSLIEDTNTTYTLSLSGTNLILSGSDNSTNSISLPTGTTYIQGSGINIDSNSNTISISSNAGLYGYSNNSYGNKITFSRSTPTSQSGDKNGDICFVY